MRKEVQAKTELMEKSVRVAEREYSKKMADLNRGFEVFTLAVSLGGSLMYVIRQSATPSQAWRVA